MTEDCVTRAIDIIFLYGNIKQDNPIKLGYETDSGEAHVKRSFLIATIMTLGCQGATRAFNWKLAGLAGVGITAMCGFYGMHCYLLTQNETTNMQEYKGHITLCNAVLETPSDTETDQLIKEVVRKITFNNSRERARAALKHYQDKLRPLTIKQGKYYTCLALSVTGALYINASAAAIINPYLTAILKRYMA